MQPELKQGTELQGGKYIIRQVLGQGGFGIMYLAYQRSLGREVAVKEFFMKRDCERDDGGNVSVGAAGRQNTVNQMRQKFLSEARMLASINHPHIVSVIDVWQENGTAYYSMPYLSGSSLKDKVLQHGPLDEATALRYVAQVASAIQYLHNRQICHYDIKPGNILLDNDDNAVLIDFGNSRDYCNHGEETIGDDSVMPISQGYSPAEQTNQLAAFSPKCDVYALGATLYFLMTRHTPPAAKTREAGKDLADQRTVFTPRVRALINDATRTSADSRLGSVERFIQLAEEVHQPGRLSHIFQRFRVKHWTTQRALWVFVTALAVTAVCTYLVKSCISMMDPIKQLEKDMVLVEGGTFKMGALDGDTLAEENEKQHQVSCASFYICKYEVTQELWMAVMGYNPSMPQGKRLPVVNVSYDDCLKFIDKLNAKTGKNYRLPTEIEWEYAARGGNQSRGYLYSGSNNLDKVAWYKENSRDEATDTICTHAVGGKSPNELGLFDMTGNVLEWTCTKNERNEIDPKLDNIPNGSKGNFRHTMRGGSSHSDNKTSRITYRRAYGTQGKKTPFVGLRLVRSR